MQNSQNFWTQNFSKNFNIKLNLIKKRNFKKPILDIFLTDKIIYTI